MPLSFFNYFIKTYSIYLSDATLVCSPQDPRPAHYIRGKHPYWKHMMGTHMLIDPCGKSPSGKQPCAIAYWDTRHEKANFFTRGFLFVNPNDQANFRFCVDPFVNPFPGEEGAPTAKGSPGGPQLKTRAAVLSYTEEFDPSQYLDDVDSHIIKVHFQPHADF